MLDPFQLPFMQRAALEFLLLAPIAGLLGAQIVLRGLAFLTHAVGASTFPGLVIAAPLGIPPQLAALGVGGAFATLLGRPRRGGVVSRDATIALLLVAALAIGIVLAGDVFESGAAVDRMLFGSILAIGAGELAAGAVAVLIVLILSARYRRDWIVDGFDGEGEGSGRGGVQERASTALLVAVTIASIVTLDAVGALLVSSLLVIPAAIVRPHARSLRGLEVGAAVTALLVGLAGLLSSYHLDLPPGATTATLGALAFLASVGFRSLCDRPRPLAGGVASRG